MEYIISKLQEEAIRKHSENLINDQNTIIKEMIRKTFQMGREEGKREVLRDAKERLEGLIPDDLDNY